MIRGMALPDLSAALDQIEQGLLTDLEIVRSMKAMLLRRRPLTFPAEVIAAMLPVGAPTTAASPEAPASTQPPPGVPAPAPYVPPPRHPNWFVKDAALAVRQVIDTLNGTFGIGDVKAQLNKQHYQTFGDSTIRSVLQDMQTAGELVLTARGIGRGGNKYSKPAPVPSPESPPA